MATGKSGGWTQIARKELGDATRSWRLQLLVAFFGLLGAAVGYLADQNVGQGVVLLLAFLAPLVGLLFTHHTIIQKRETDELAVLLSLPFSRRDIVLGAYLGRMALLLVGLAALAVAATVFGAVSGTVPELSGLLGAFCIAAVLGTIFVSIAIGVSASVRSSAVASAGVFGTYLLFAFQIWTLVPDAVLYLVNGFEVPDTDPTWALVFEQLSPFAAVRNAAVPVTPDLAEAVPLVGASVPESLPLYMQPAFASVLVVLWLVVPALLGYLQFERTDL